MQRLAAVGAHIGYIGAAAQIASAERRKRDVAGGAVSRGRGTGAGAPACGRRWGRRVGPGRRHFPLATNQTTLAAC